MATILVVEDDPAVRQAMLRYLKGQGHEVVEAADGFEALAALETHDIEVALVDLDLPKMHGIELVLHLRQQWPDLKTAVLSGIDEAIARAWSRLGSIPALQKPFTLEELGRLVRKLLG